MKLAVVEFLDRHARGGEQKFMQSGRQMGLATMASSRADVVTFPKANSDTAENRSAKVRQDVYKQAGVDTAEADVGLNHIIDRVQTTWPKRGLGRHIGG